MTPPKMIAKAVTVWAIATSAILAILSSANDLLLPPSLQTLGHLLYRVVFWLSLPMNTLTSWFWPPEGHQRSLGFWVLASLLTPLFYALIWHILRRLGLDFRSGRRSGAPEPTVTRRVFMRRATVGSLGIGGLAFGYGTLFEPGFLRIRRYVAPIADLPSCFQGLRIAHVSDTHYGPYVPLPFIEAAVRQTNALGADLIVLTGDYIHRTERAIRPGIGALGLLRAQHGVFAVLGNHDHWHGANGCRDMLEKIGATLVENSGIYLGPEGITSEPAAPTIYIAGVGDLWEDEVSFDRALADVSRSVPRILLSHNPDVAELLTVEHRVDLMLCGHTHGGQVRLPGLGTPIVPSRYGQKYAGGLCQGPHCPVLVSRGVGMAVLPVRVGVPPEISLITLESA